MVDVPTNGDTPRRRRCSSPSSSFDRAPDHAELRAAAAALAAALDRLEALLVSMATLAPVTPDRVLYQVEQSVTSFRGTREPFDDATMMAVRIG